MSLVPFFSAMRRLFQFVTWPFSLAMLVNPGDSAGQAAVAELSHEQVVAIQARLAKPWRSAFAGALLLSGACMASVLCVPLSVAVTMASVVTFAYLLLIHSFLFVLSNAFQPVSASAKPCVMERARQSPQAQEHLMKVAVLRPLLQIDRDVVEHILLEAALTRLSRGKLKGYLRDLSQAPVQERGTA